MPTCLKRSLISKRTTCAVILSLGLIGCGGAADRETAADNPDSTEVVSPRDANAPPPASGSADEIALRTVLQEVLRGARARAPTDTWFSPATAGALRSVSVDSAGHAIVDFEDLGALIPNASSSAGSVMLLEELNTAVFSVDGVHSVDYSIEGRCERFWGWLQRGCETIHRPA